MKIQLLSDLHLEVHPHYQATPAADAEVLVLAGDIGSYQEGSLLQGEYFGLERFPPAAICGLALPCDLCAGQP